MPGTWAGPSPCGEDGGARRARRSARGAARATRSAAARAPALALPAAGSLAAGARRADCCPGSHRHTLVRSPAGRAISQGRRRSSSRPIASPAPGRRRRAESGPACGRVEVLIGVAGKDALHERDSPRLQRLRQETVCLQASWFDMLPGNAGDYCRPALLAAGACRPLRRQRPPSGGRGRARAVRLGGGPSARLRVSETALARFLRPVVDEPRDAASARPRGSATSPA